MNTCVCCGMSIPEGRMICIGCESEAEENAKRGKKMKKNHRNRTPEFFEFDADISDRRRNKKSENR